MTSRARIPHKVELAAALLQIHGEDGSPPIPYEHARLMSAEQVISCFNRDHYPVRKEDGGEDVHWNIVWRFIGAHRRKTATIDRPQSAKGTRIRDDLAAFNARIAAKDSGQITRERPRSRLQSRGFDKRVTRGMNGKVRARKTRNASTPD